MSKDEQANTVSITSPMVTLKRYTYRPVVSFWGKAGSGKSQAARILVTKYGYKPISFATPIKNVMEKFLDIFGEDRNHVWSKKQQPIASLNGLTGRYLLQTFGTEWGRDLIDKNLWANIARKRISTALGRGERVVIDDLSFVNEEIMLQEFGASIVQITRDDEKDLKHTSENQNLTSDYVLENNGNLTTLTKKLKCIITI